MDPVTRVLVVANRTSSTPRLLAEVRRRAKEKPCAFTLLIPDATSRADADWTLETAVPMLSRAAHDKVDSCVGGPDPFVAVKEAVAGGDYDEIMVSTLPRRTSTWLRRDLIRRVEGLGLPVTAIVPKKGKLTKEEEMELATLPGGMM